ncbi:hypothetical protein QUF74_04610 [Candidatus Halobeggiatoa sp. HSG11]|nr:hypothetical protein [Candidatus Halobeggiatoa sp. HSG11]
MIDENTPWHKVIDSHRYEILQRYGFSEGSSLLPEEVPFVEQARDKLIELMGIIENRWQPKASFADCPYIYFEDLKEKEKVEFYDMGERDRRLVDRRIDEVLECY